MDEEYDVIVLGTGLTECIMSGLVSVDGKKVLHMDRNDYYGGESASLNLTQLYQKFRQTDPPAELGKDRDWNIDLVPKLMMACEDLVNILVYTDVTRYLEFKQISASYVYKDKKIAKVPSNQTEAISSPLLGLFEKNRVRQFYSFIQHCDPDKPETQKGFDVKKNTTEEIFKYYGLEPGTQDYFGHALCLYLNDDYKKEPFLETLNRTKLYTSSIARYGKSPYIYPLYGLGELPQGFARLSAIYGGTYMLAKPCDEIVMENGVVVGVKSEGEIAKCKAVICDPSYAPKELLKSTGKVIRSICILNHAIPNTADSDSIQIILPAAQILRKHDIYIASISAIHNVCAKGHWIAIVSTVVETEEPEKEIDVAVKLLGPIIERFTSVTEMYAPINDGKDSNLFISKSYDPTSHFQTVSADVRDLYLRSMGKEMSLKKREQPQGEGEEEEK